MSIFGSIFSKIFGTEAKAEAAPAVNSPTPFAPASGKPAVTPATAAAKPVPASAPAASLVDVNAVLTQKAAVSKQKLDWQHSIVDLMKLLDLDSSLTARKELAHELNYTGDTSDSSAMNIWLHKQVMTKLAANGGRVPEDLKV